MLRKFQEDGETSEDSPLWALDISSGYLANGKIRAAPRSSTLPIHTPDAARAYLLKSFYNVPKDGNETAKVVPTTVAQRIENLGMLLKALDALFSSWVGVLSKQELDRKAWAWYVDVRPEVEGGVKGWGEKGILELGKILSLRRVDVKDEKTDGGS